MQLSVTLALPHVINVLVMSSDRRRFCSGTRHVYAGGSAMFSEWHPMDDRAWDLQDSWICRYSGGVQCPSSSESSKRHGYLFFEGILHTLGLIFEGFSIFKWWSTDRRRLTYWLTHKLTHWLTYWQTDFLTDQLTKSLTDWLIDCLTNQQTDCLFICLSVCLTDCLIDQLTGWLTNPE